MDVGDLLLQALLSLLCGALGYMLFLKACIIPEGTTVFDVYDNVGYEMYETETILPP